MRRPRYVEYDKAHNQIVILNQGRIPFDPEKKTLTTLDDVVGAIQKLEVRGAPAIGIAAAWGLAMYANSLTTTDMVYFLGQVQMARDYLSQARPTAVDLFHGLDAVYHATDHKLSQPVARLQESMIKAAQQWQEAIEEDTYKIGKHGSTLIEDGDGILTYCNAGALATGGGYGTALAPIYLGAEKVHHVYAAETRPVLQGARLTAYELTEANIPTTVITDNAVATLMAQGKIQRIFVGCDRMARNGDFANKIGTLGIAILAKHYDIPLYVCLPKTTLDLTLASGADIPIEEHTADEVAKKWLKQRMVTEKAEIYAPAFDVTPAHLARAIITEDGVYETPHLWS